MSLSVRSILPSLLLGAAMAIGAAAQASATIYTYTGNTDQGNYETAPVDLNCAGACAAGYYIYSSGISSFSLTANSSTNTLVPGIRGE